ncbi:MAG: hypothetical protein IKN86_10145 [Bacteroidaceae bacterium]|nr:hypothetical protein [Bacteroidaceae bacterium]
MKYDKHIDKTEEELCKLKEVYSRNEVDRFTDGLEAGRINTEEKIVEFTNYIRTSDGLTQLEHSRLVRLLEEGFIEKFATNYNLRYGTCNMLMGKMRSSISRGMQMLEKLCNKKRSRGSDNTKRKVIDNSKMGNSPYNSALWGLEFYKDSVSTLYNEIVAYEGHLKQCIDLCLYIIEQVAYIKEHPETAHEKHQKSRREVLLNNRSVIKRFIDMNAEMENDLMDKVEAWKQEKKTMEEICAQLYHTLDENEYNDWVISEEVMAARRQGITNQERALWGDDKQQVMRCRTAYMHIDELNPDGQKGRIGGRFLAMLHKWSKVQSSRGLEYWHTYFTDFYRNNGGQMAPVKIGAIKRGQSLITRNIIKQKEVDNFNQKMDYLVEKYMKTLTD